MKLSKGINNRGVIFFFYDKQGIVDRYVTYMLEAMKTTAKDLFIVSNGKLEKSSREKFLNYTEYVWERENKGLDVGAYKYALEKIGWDRIKEYDELVLMNHTIMGPIYPIQEMFDKMAEEDLDFWGLSIHHKIGFDPFGTTDCGYVREHLQSHFIVARKSLLSSPDYRKYWEQLPEIKTYNDSIGRHETYFTHHFAEMGYKWTAYASWKGEEDVSVYPLQKIPVELIKKTRCPFFKRRNFMHDYDDFLYSGGGEATSRLMEFLKTETDYDVDMIWENILRTANMADIKKCLNLNYIVSSEKSNDMSSVIETKKVAFIYHFYYEDCLEDCLHYASSLPAIVDIYITTGTEEKKKLLEKAFEQFKNRVKVLLVDNRGRDVSALLIGAKEIVPNYEYICFAHDKKVAQLKPQSQGNSWSYKCFESVLKNQNVVNNIIELFEKNPRLGMLSPAPPIHANYYCLLGTEWTINFENVKKLADEMQLNVPMDANKEPIAPIGTIFWFRTKALQRLFDCNWKYEDFPAEPALNDGMISHAIERLYPFVPQAEGYYPAWIFNAEGAALEITNLYHMLRGMNVQLFMNGVGGGFYFDILNNMAVHLSEGGEHRCANPKLYLDYGDGYNEKCTITSKNYGEEGTLKVVFEWEVANIPQRVRFDPCEKGNIVLNELQMEFILENGKTKPVSMAECICNGVVSDQIVEFPGEDPWIDIPVFEKRKIKGLWIHSILGAYGKTE